MKFLSWMEYFFGWCSVADGQASTATGSYSNLYREFPSDANSEPEGSRLLRVSCLFCRDCNGSLTGEHSSIGESSSDLAGPTITCVVCALSLYTRPSFSCRVGLKVFGCCKGLSTLRLKVMELCPTSFESLAEQARDSLSSTCLIPY